MFFSSVTELCHCVESLQPLAGESFQHRLANGRMGPILMLLLMVFGNVFRKLILMSRCLFLLLPHTVQYLYPSITGMQN